MRILAIGDSLKQPSGYGRLNKKILGHFVKRGHQVFQIGWGHSEPAENISMQDDSGTFVGNITLIPPFTGDPFATEATVLSAQGYKPHMLYNSNDYFTSMPLLEMTKKMVDGQPKFLPPFWTQYGVIDGPYCAEWAYKTIIQSINAPISPSKYGFEQLKKVTDKAMYIPHGVDLNIYHPLPNAEEIKAKLGLSNKFVFGCVNRNIWRKQFIMLLKAFANLKYRHGLKDIVLYLIADPRDAFGHDLVAWAKAMNLTISKNPAESADIMFHPGFINAILNLSEQDLVAAYSTFNVHVSASMSEGFGLSTLESQACGIPNIICDNTANTELVQGHGWLYPTAKYVDGSPVLITPTTQFGQITYLYEMPDIVAMENAMLEAYNKSELRAQYARNSFEFAQQYSWSNILPMWDTVLTKAESEQVI